MAAELEVRWSDEAIRQSDAMAAFIAMRWTAREVNHFFDLLAEFQRLVAVFPNTYPVSNDYKGCRRAMIHPNASVVYEVRKDVVHIVTIVDNRSSKRR